MTLRPWTRRRWLQAAPAVPAAVLTLPPGRARAAAPGDLIAWPALTTLDGRTLPPAHWAGTPAVVVFWATWCGYCLRHNTRLQRLHERVDPARLRLLGVAVDGTDDSVRAHLQRHGHHFPVVRDDGSLRARFTTRRMVPITCTVGRDGRLLQTIPGEMAEDDVLGLARLAA